MRRSDQETDMKKYEVVIHYTSSKVFDSSKATPEEALESTLDRASVSVCHQCSRELGSEPQPTGYAVFNSDGNEVLKGDL